MRISIAAYVLVAIFLLGCDSGGSSEDTMAPRLSALELEPVLVAYQGNVWASVQATDNKTVAGVRLIASGPTTEQADLTKTSPGVYEGELLLPSHGGDAEAIYEIRAEAWDAAGNSAETASVQVIVDNPPPPPVLP